jgi:hypothetical protein
MTALLLLLLLDDDVVDDDVELVSVVFLFISFLL